MCRSGARAMVLKPATFINLAQHGGTRQQVLSSTPHILTGWLGKKKIKKSSHICARRQRGLYKSRPICACHKTPYSGVRGGKERGVLVTSPDIGETRHVIPTCTLDIGGPWEPASTSSKISKIWRTLTRSNDWAEKTKFSTQVFYAFENKARFRD